ncbi:MAG: hypothetical protein KTR31_41075 [Myxococcales bacterium]|nr:hypothetical protein [Myxococcales bacterium]
MNIRRVAIVCFVLLALGADDCRAPSGHLLENGSFDRWCAEGPCGWQVTGGAVDALSTWHALDLAVQLSDRGVALEQVATSADPQVDEGCLQVRALANVLPRDPLRLELDFRSDGTVEYSTLLEGREWAEDERFLVIPRWFDRVRVRLVSEGRGGSSLGELRLVRLGGACPGVEVMLTTELGDPCSGSDQCDQDHCTALHGSAWIEGDWWPDSTCAECDQDSCGAGLTCGAVWATAPYPHRACEPVAEGSLGELCATDEECVTGLCCQGRCSECCEGEDECSDGTCSPRLATDGGGVLARVCEYVVRPAGASCLDHRDCRSMQCVGEELRVCSDSGRVCASDEGCPLQEGACVLAGVAHGVCE